jgi:hypothetical protein
MPTQVGNEGMKDEPVRGGGQMNLTPFLEENDYPEDLGFVARLAECPLTPGPSPARGEGSRDSAPFDFSF